MKQSVLGRPPHSFQRMLRRCIAICIAALALTSGLNILFTTLRTEQNHTRMLVLNILTDILCGFFLVYYVYQKILPRYQLFRLSQRPKSVLQGTLRHIRNEALRYMDIDCYPLDVDGRRLFLPAGTLVLQEGGFYTFSVVSNIIVEAEQ